MIRYSGGSRNQKAKAWIGSPLCTWWQVRETERSYVGVTSNLAKRVWEHKNNVVQGFTQTYGHDRLVWYEVHETMESAVVREKRIKSSEKNMEVGID